VKKDQRRSQRDTQVAAAGDQNQHLFHKPMKGGAWTGAKDVFKAKTERGKKSYFQKAGQLHAWLERMGVVERF